jgi:hypothetical protein
VSKVAASGVSRSRRTGRLHGSCGRGW